MRIASDWCKLGKPDIYLDDQKLNPADLIWADDEKGEVGFIDRSIEVTRWNAQTKSWDRGIFTKEAIEAAGGTIPTRIERGKVRFEFSPQTGNAA
jgi:hypothetical protein